MRTYKGKERGLQTKMNKWILEMTGLNFWTLDDDDD